MRSLRDRAKTYGKADSHTVVGRMRLGSSVPGESVQPIRLAHHIAVQSPIYSWRFDVVVLVSTSSTRPMQQVTRAWTWH
jgi:hypothetical protein